VQRSSAIIVKGDFVYGYLHQGHQIDGRPAAARAAGYLLRGTADPQGAAEDDRQGDQQGPRRRAESPSGGDKQVDRLGKVFGKLGKEPSGTQCPAIDGIIKEADATAGEIEDKAVLDAAIVANAQAVEHYEMCRYGTLIAWSEELGHDDIVRFLTTNLNEEKAANTKLNTVALRKGVNARASSAA
jgi:ferritin-like metal-binding protein YciE